MIRILWKLDGRTAPFILFSTLNMLFHYYFTLAQFYELIINIIVENAFFQQFSDIKKLFRDIEKLAKK